MPTTLLRIHPTGRKASFRARQAGLAQATPLPPPPPPTQIPLPQKPRWTLPFIWMTTMVTAAVCFLPDLFCKLALGPPSRSTAHETKTRYWGMVRKWEDEQDRRAQGGMAWLYTWEYLAGDKLLDHQGIRRSVSVRNHLVQCILTLASRSRAPPWTCWPSVSVPIPPRTIKKMPLLTLRRGEQVDCHVTS